jgi:ribose transport system substrate-binding protein
MRRSSALRALTGVLACGVLALSACTVASSQTDSGPVQATASIADAKDLKIAYFSAGTSNQYLQAAIDEAKKFAGEKGVTVDVFDGQFDAQVQFDQMQTALTSGKYNAFAVEPNDGNLVCNLLTRDAPRRGVLVSVFNLPICGRATNLGEQTWQPGTVTYVGGQTLDVYKSWVEQVKAAHPDGATIALISGPDLNANTLSFFEAAKAFDAPKYRIVAQQTTDYTTPQAFEAAQTIVRATPHLDVLMSNFSGMTRGVVQATAGTDVQVYDFGGDTWALDNVRSRALAGTVMMLPRQETREALQALVDTVSKAEVTRFVNLTGSSTLPGTPFVTPANVGDFTAEY